mgnify:FL=1
MNDEIRQRKQNFQELFNSDRVNNFLNSEYFELSQQIMNLEHELKLDQKQTANVLGMSLQLFLQFEMGVSTDVHAYHSIIRRLNQAKDQQIDDLDLTVVIRNSQSLSDSVTVPVKDLGSQAANESVSALSKSVSFDSSSEKVTSLTGWR